MKLPHQYRYWHLRAMFAPCLFDKEVEAFMFIDILMLNEGWWK